VYAGANKSWEDDMAVLNAIASIAVNDLSSASGWYEKLLGRPADSRPMPEVAEWKFERGGWLQVYQLPERAGAGSVTLAVSDMAAQLAHLKAAGIEVGQALPGAKVTTLMLTDPDGNHIAFAQAHDSSIAQ
jgi:predicted enzyme related to lactoylglutathione lyase